MSGGFFFFLILFALLPFAASMFVLSRYSAWQAWSEPWRKKLWLIGMSVVTAFSLTLVIALCLNLFPESAATRTTNLYSIWLFSGVFLVPAGAILIGFGSGRLRWMGLLAAMIDAGYIVFAIHAAALGMAGI